MRLLLEILICNLFQRILTENRIITTQQSQKSQLFQTVLQNSTYSQLEIHYELQDNSVIMIDTLPVCSCSEQNIKQECKKKFGCKWEDESCYNQLCSDYTDQWPCQKRLNCIWDQFTCIDMDPLNCSHHKYLSSCEEQDNCVFLNNECRRGKVNCQDYSEFECHEHYYCIFLNNQCLIKKDVVCEQISNDNDCRDFDNDYNDFKHCYWIEDKCQTIEIKNCNDIEIEYLCDYYYCEWENNSCQEKSCENQENECYSYITLRNKEYIVKLCKKNENFQCKPVYNLDIFGADECQQVTFGTHHWDGEKCQQCSDIQLLKLYLILFIIFL